MCICICCIYKYNYIHIYIYINTNTYIHTAGLFLYAHALDICSTCPRKSTCEALPVVVSCLIFFSDLAKTEFRSSNYQVHTWVEKFREVGVLISAGM